jgi:cell division protein FtsB
MYLLGKLGDLWTGWRQRAATAGVSFIACYVLYVVIFGSNGWLVYRQKKTAYDKLQQEVQLIEQENKQLQGSIKALKTDPKAIEKEAREQLRYAKPGEVIYVIPERQAQPSTATAKK